MHVLTPAQMLPGALKALSMAMRSMLHGIRRVVQQQRPQSNVLVNRLDKRQADTEPVSRADQCRANSVT